MRERNLTVGGFVGYDSSKVRRSLNVPSSNGVSARIDKDQYSVSTTDKCSERTWTKDHGIP